MSTARRVPINRGRPASGGTRRAVAHPGVDGTNAAAAFKSPYQPPTAVEDLAGDISTADPNAWQVTFIGGAAWRLRIPTPADLGVLAEVATLKGGAQVDALNRFVLGHLHPDDVEPLLNHMADPDVAFGGDQFQELYRFAVTVGTARPFGPWSVSRQLLHSAGGPSGRSWHWAESPDPSKLFPSSTRCLMS